jgi:hypothetical protein
MKTKFTKGNWRIEESFIEGSPIPIQIVLMTDERIDMGTSPIICDLYGQWTKEGKANANLLLYAKDMFYEIVLTAHLEGWQSLFYLIEKITGYEYKYGTPEFDSLVEEAENYLKSK